MVCLVLGRFVERVVGVAPGAFTVESSLVRFVDRQALAPAADEIGVGDGRPTHDHCVRVAVGDGPVVGVRVRVAVGADGPVVGVFVRAVVAVGS